MKKLIILVGLIALISQTLKGQDLSYYKVGRDKLMKRDTLSELQKIEAAIPYFKKSAFTNPNHLESRSSLLNCQLKINNYQGVVETANDAIDIIEKINTQFLPYYYAQAGFAEHKLGNIEASKNYFHRTIEALGYALLKTPNDIDFISSKAHYLCLIDRKEEALRFIKNSEVEPCDDIEKEVLFDFMQTFDANDFLNSTKSIHTLQYDYYDEINNVRERERSKYQSFDFLGHDYKYLDKNFNLKITDKKFQMIISEYNLQSYKLRNSYDSLRVILEDEFDNNVQRQLAFEHLYDHFKAHFPKPKKASKTIEVPFEVIQTSGHFSDRSKQVHTQIFLSAFSLFNKNVELKDGMYQVNIQSGDDINISPELYELFSNYYSQLNTEIKKMCLIKTQGEFHLEYNPDGPIKDISMRERFHWDWEMVWDFYQSVQNKHEILKCYPNGNKKLLKSLLDADNSKYEIIKYFESGNIKHIELFESEIKICTIEYDELKNITNYNFKVTEQNQNKVIVFGDYENKLIAKKTVIFVLNFPYLNNELIEISLTNGDLKRDGINKAKYHLTPKRPGNSIVKLFINTTSGKQLIDEVEFKIGS